MTLNRFAIGRDPSLVDVMVRGKTGVCCYSTDFWMTDAMVLKEVKRRYPWFDTTDATVERNRFAIGGGR